MWKMRQIICLAASLLVLCSPALAKAASIPQEVTTYAIRPPVLPDGRCMLGFRLELTNAEIQSVTDLPQAFSIAISNSVSNGPDDRTLIVGGRQRTGILDSSEIAQMRFHVVKGKPEDGPFTAKGFVRTFTLPDLDDPKQIDLGPENFVIVK